MYFYLQGYSLTIGENVTMQNYATSNTNQGLLGGNAPAFHIFVVGTNIIIVLCQEKMQK